MENAIAARAVHPVRITQLPTRKPRLLRGFNPAADYGAALSAVNEVWEDFPILIGACGPKVSGKLPDTVGNFSRRTHHHRDDCACAVRVCRTKNVRQGFAPRRPQAPAPIFNAKRAAQVVVELVEQERGGLRVVLLEHDHAAAAARRSGQVLASFFS
jgi:hypothetical protein